MGDAPRSLPHHTEVQHASFRSPRSVLITSLGALSLLLLAMPEVTQRTLQVTRLDAAIVVGGFLVLSLLAAVAFHRAGFSSRVYQSLNRWESIWAALGSLALVYRSGSARSFFWAVFIGLVGQAGAYGGFRRFNLSLFVSAVLLLAAAFGVSGQPGDVVMTLLLGGFAIATYFTLLASTLRLARALDLRALQDAERLELNVLRERARIARDLHDGLGAELTGLLYRAQAVETPDEALIERARSCVDELRTSVWLLREGPQRTGTAFVTWLRERCLDLCANTCQLSLVAEGDASLLSGELAVHVTRMTLEAVRNAVRHAQATKVEVHLRFAPRLALTVGDDGVGLPEGAWALHDGGLANLRARAALTGARAAVETTRGTTLRFEW